MEQVNSFFQAWMGWITLFLILWTIPWKGVALWRSARNSQKAWFIVLLIFNTLAILEIIYILGFSKKKPLPSD